MKLRQISGLLLGSLTAATLVSCRTPQVEARLEGSWRSNKDETVARWKQERVLSPVVIENFEKNVLGKMTMTYGEGKVTATLGNWKEVQPYEIVESGKDYVILEQFSILFESNLRLKLQFANGGYWVFNDAIAEGYVEKFDRLKP